MVSESLWNSSDAKQWQSHLDNYEKCLDENTTDEVKILDNWYRLELPKQISARTPAHMNKSELSKLMQWKLKKGKWFVEKHDEINYEVVGISKLEYRRPRLQEYVDGLAEEDVINSTAKAFSLCESTEMNNEALESLTNLKGIGQATASAVMGAYQPQYYPYMSDEALNAVAEKIGIQKYTLPQYLNFSAALQEKAKWLSDETNSNWTAQEVQMSLWVYHQDQKALKGKQEQKLPQTESPQPDLHVQQQQEQLAAAENLPSSSLIPRSDDSESNMEESLWDCSDSQKWQSNLDNYEHILIEKKSEDVKMLDAWYRLELPQQILARNPAHITKSELSKVLQWKLKKGKWLPLLEEHVESLAEEDVINATRDAFSLCESAALNNAALQVLVELRGVGVDTASAILGAYQPQYYPYMSDEALCVAIEQIGKKKFSLPQYLRFSSALQEKAKWLSVETHSNWTAQQVQMSLWAYHQQYKPFKVKQAKSKVQEENLQQQQLSNSASPVDDNMANESLWGSSDLQKWQLNLDKYENILSEKKPEDVKILDNWYRLELPLKISARSPEHMIKSELSKLMEWKLKKGKWCPLLQEYVDDLAEEDVINSTKKAFSLCDESTALNESALQALIELKGVGPDTASAVLATYQPEYYPYMSDEALSAVAEQAGDKKHTLSQYLSFSVALQEKAKWLSEEANSIWTAQEVQMSLWAYHQDQNQSRETKEQQLSQLNPHEDQQQEQIPGSENLPSSSLNPTSNESESNMEESLWYSSDCQKWQSNLDNYENTLTEKKSEEVKDLDNWYRSELPQQLLARSPAYINKSELSKVLQWKLKKGKWCPLLEEHVESLREEDVINLTSTAFSYCESAALNNMALQVLIELRGVGVDTASAILSAYQPQYYPYMSDEALGVAIEQSGKKKYSLPNYLRFAVALQEKAKWLSTQTHSSWTAQQVQMSLWAYHQHQKPQRIKRQLPEAYQPSPALLNLSHSQSLWISSDAQQWLSSLNSYEAVFAQNKPEDAKALDDWYRLELPQQILARDPAHMFKFELSKLMQWKLKKEKWCPLLQGHVDSLAEEEVISATMKAFSLCDSAALNDEALQALVELKGVGVDTASAILGTYQPQYYPFMSDEALGVAVEQIGNKKYSLPQYLRFSAALQEKAEWLSRETEPSWTAQQVEMSLWAYHHQNQPQMSTFKRQKSNYQPNHYQLREYQPRHFQPRHFQPRHFQPRSYQPRSYQPRSYQPRSYQPRSYHQQHQSPRPSYQQQSPRGYQLQAVPQTYQPRQVFQSQSYQQQAVPRSYPRQQPVPRSYPQPPVSRPYQPQVVASLYSQQQQQVPRSYPQQQQQVPRSYPHQQQQVPRSYPHQQQQVPRSYQQQQQQQVSRPYYPQQQTPLTSRPYPQTPLVSQSYHHPRAAAAAQQVTPSSYAKQYSYQQPQPRPHGQPSTTHVYNQQVFPSYQTTPATSAYQPGQKRQHM